MSIILKGIDVPKSNGHFELYTSANGKWRIVANDGAIDVEAIQIPKTIICENLLRDIEYEVHKDEFDY